MLDDGGLQVAQVLRLEGVRLVVGEGAVELEVERDDLERQLGQSGAGAEDGRDRVAAHAVARVDDDLERAPAGQVDQAAQERGVVAEQVALDDRAGGRAGRARAACPCRAAPARGRARRPDRESWPDGAGAGAAELDPVVLRPGCGWR